MKTVVMDRNFRFRLAPQAHVEYLAGETYKRRPEAQVRAIVEAGAGRIVDERSEP